jgi:xylulokinase
VAWLGLDIGTSAVKAVLVDENERVLAAAEAPLETLRPGPGLSEQDPAQWWQAVEGLFDRWQGEDPGLLARVRGIGLSGQMHGAVCLGADDLPLRPAILWNDSRAEAEAAALNRDHPDLPSRLGVPCAPGFTAPKLPWLARHEPEVFARTRLVLNPKDLVRLTLTGEKVSDMSDAAGTWWLDQAARDWSDAALAATGLDRSAMPRLVEGIDAAGFLRPIHARRWGFTGEVVVAGGAGDAIAGAVGIGSVERGAFLSLGTSAQFFAPGTSYRPLPERFLHAFCHCAPGLWFQMGAMLNGASTLAFLSEILGEPIEALLATVAGQPSRPSPVLFLPYLTGERTPHNDAFATGVFSGLTPATTRADLTRAVLEGVAFAFADAAACLAAAGTELEAAAFIGGGARSAAWAQILADVLGLPITRYVGGEKGPAFGAARLARAAVTGEDIRAFALPPATLDVAEPRPALVDAYRERLVDFRALYRGTRAAREGRI